MNSVAEIYGGYTNSTARAMIMIPIYLSIYGRPNPITRWRKALGIGNPFPPLDHLRPFGIPMDDRSRRAEHTAGCAPVGSVLAELMIRRTFLSRIPFDSDIAIGAHIPPLQREVVDVTFNYVEADEYKKFSLPHKRGLFIKSQIDPNKYVWNMKKLRKLVLLTSWLGFHYLESALHAENIATILLNSAQVTKSNLDGHCSGHLKNGLLDEADMLLYKKLLLYQIKSVCSYDRNRVVGLLRGLANLDDSSSTKSGFMAMALAAKEDIWLLLAA
ncbi:hypothetical protein CDV55_101181 [Aspergillus turcosus]|nr:hypothetical protein CDV55_101181 [Aspergillus turcosus]